MLQTLSRSASPLHRLCPAGVQAVSGGRSHKSFPSCIYNGARLYEQHIPYSGEPTLTITQTHHIAAFSFCFCGEKACYSRVCAIGFLCEKLLWCGRVFIVVFCVYSSVLILIELSLLHTCNLSNPGSACWAFRPKPAQRRVQGTVGAEVCCFRSHQTLI